MLNILIKCVKESFTQLQIQILVIAKMQMKRLVYKAWHRDCQVNKLCLMIKKLMLQLFPRLLTSSSINSLRERNKSKLKNKLQQLQQKMLRKMLLCLNHQYLTKQSQKQKKTKLNKLKFQLKQSKQLKRKNKRQLIPPLTSKSQCNKVTWIKSKMMSKKKHQKDRITKTILKKRLQS